LQLVVVELKVQDNLQVVKERQVVLQLFQQ
jgi:hypothetical protein